MSGNPNTQKLGKRRNPAGQPQPDWLFPGTNNKPAPPKTENAQQMKKDKKLAEDLLKRRAASEPKSGPSPELLELVSQFLDENEFMVTSRSLKTELQSRGKTTAKSNGAIPPLSTIYNEWRQSKEEVKAAPTAAPKDGPAGSKEGPKQKAKAGKQRVAQEEESSSGESSSGESSDGDSDIEMTEAPPAKKASTRKASPSPSSSSDSSSSSSSDSDADDEDEAPMVAKVPSPKPKANALKRKAASSSSDSSSSDSDADSASEADIPNAKKAKIASSSSGSDSSSDSDSTSEDEIPNGKKAKASSSDSSSESSSDSESSSGSDSSTQSIAKKIPLPDSDSDSSSSDEESDSAKDTDMKIVLSSDTSATLSDGPKKSGSSLDFSSSDSDEESKTAAHQLSPPLPPTPVAKLPRKTNAPFSRIPKDTEVDPRLASNAYVPYDYAQKAHEDLIVTRGKGFTKEKNKKKRGSYKGGFIDVDGKKGIKFDD